HDPPEDDPPGVRVLHRAQQVPGERVYRRDRSGAALHRLLETFAVDPVADPVGEGPGRADVVDVADRGMVELAQRFGLAQEPGSGRLVGVEVEPQAYAPSEHL